MAKKRMISLQITDSDDFLEMPLTAQALYFHLLIRCDDEGFTNGVKKVMRIVGAREDDLKVLIGKRFVLTFESGVIVIKHWLIHNNIRNDRIIPTVHQKEKGTLMLNGVNGYTEAKEQPSDIMEPSVSLDLGLDLGLDIDLKEDNVEQSPTIPYQEIISYLNQKIGTSYKATSRETQRLIKARYKQGFNINDFYKVIDNKYDDWFKTDMQQYLRPITLFGSKFESYLNQTPKKTSDITQSKRYKEVFGE